MSLIFSLAILCSAHLAASALPLDLNGAEVRIENRNPPAIANTAAQVLREEVQKRTPQSSPAPNPALITLHLERGKNAPLPPESYQVRVDHEATAPQIRIIAPDGRGLLYGAGYLLQKLSWTHDSLTLNSDISTTASPQYSLRGHQLGYRTMANSYDAWTPEQYDTYIRELALFGVNAIENIPFQDTKHSPHMKISRSEMNLAISEICARYDMDYWLFIAADFDLTDTTLRAEHLRQHEQLYSECERIDALLMPGGDPGHNHPRDVMPYLEDLSKSLLKHHPNAGIWMSLQTYDKEKIDYFYQWIEEHKPAWFKGIVSGPSSPPMDETRKRLAPEYQHRYYPDITHVVRCQYPIPWLDQAFALTLGREPVNPTPVFQSLIHNTHAPFTDGFVAYSDGIHDDVNKHIWSGLGWDSSRPVREILNDYCRFHFGEAVAEDAADGILALEKNWEGPLRVNGAVTSTLELWERMTAENPELAANWRWQMCLLRAMYDAYTRYRLIYEQDLEKSANALLLNGSFASPAAAMSAALSEVQRADTHLVQPRLREDIVRLCDDLFHSIGLQTSVKRYHASATERGAVLDFVDYPLNNRWWLEDEFQKVEALPTDEAKWARLHEIAQWETPGPGSFYDDIGNVANSPHTYRGESMNTVPVDFSGNIPSFWWWDNGFSRQRLSFQVTQDWPDELRYKHLDPAADYTLRMTGYGEAFVLADGQRLTPTLYGKEIGEIKEFPVPHSFTADGQLRITFERPEESHLNWRQQSRVAEVWLVKNK